MRRNVQQLLWTAALAHAALACTINNSGSDADGGVHHKKTNAANADDDSTGITNLGQSGSGAGARAGSGMTGSGGGAGKDTGLAGASASTGGKGGGAGASTSPALPPAMIKLPTCDTEMALPNLDKDATLEAGKCYLVSGEVRVSAATLTVQPGAILKFKQGASLTVAQEGAISALGSAEKPITFMGSITEPGHWLSLVISSDNPKNEIGFVQFAHGGSDAVCCRTGRTGAMLLVTDKSRVSIHDSIFAQSGRDAIEFEPGSKIVKFERNQFVANQGAPVRVTADNVGKLDAASNYAGTSEMPNKTPYIVVYENITVSSEATWPSVNVPYLAPAGITAAAKLTLSPGITIEFSDNMGIAIGELGVLVAAGTKDQHITLHGTHSGKWLGMLMASADEANQLKFVDIDGAGSDRWCCDSDRGYGSLHLDANAVVSIEDSSFSNGARAGMFAMDGATIKSFARNSFSKNHDAPISVRAMHMPMLDATSTFKGGNDDDEVAVLASTASRDGTWAALDVPYRLKGQVTIGSAVTIAPGAKFTVDPGTGIWVNANGSLSAMTTAGDISFGGVNDQANSWLGIGFDSSSPKNLLDGVTIDGAGSAKWCCKSDYRTSSVLLNNTAAVTVRNSKFMHYGGNAIYTLSGGTLTESANTYGATGVGP